MIQLLFSLFFLVVLLVLLIGISGTFLSFNRKRNFDFVTTSSHSYERKANITLLACALLPLFFVTTVLCIVLSR